MKRLRSNLHPLFLGFAMALCVIARGAPAAPLLVNQVPSDAVFVNYGALQFRERLSPANAAEFGLNFQVALQNFRKSTHTESNLLVLICPATGVTVPLPETGTHMNLAAENPRWIVAIYKWNPRPLTDREKAVHFTTGPTPLVKTYKGADPKHPMFVNTHITLPVNTAHIDLSFWTYLNLPRFVKIAVDYGFDTVVLKSSDKYFCTDVPLPNCDQPLRLAQVDPILDVTIGQAVK